MAFFVCLKSKQTIDNLSTINSGQLESSGELLIYICEAFGGWQMPKCEGKDILTKCAELY